MKEEYTIDLKKEYEQVRFNPNTKGMPISISEGKVNKRKKGKGTIGILGLMTALGHFEEAKKETNDNKLSTTINKMIENSNDLVNNGVRKL